MNPSISDSPTIHLAVIELTRNCNLRCKHCYGTFDGTKNMTFADFKQVCENLKAVGVSIATLSGWEPMLLWNELRSFIGYAKETFKEVRMTTNGTLLNEKTVQNILELDSIQISIDGPEDVHDAIRGVGNYRKATTAIELIKDKLPVSVMMTIHDFNHAHFQDVITYARNNNVSIGFERITNVGRGKDYNGLSKNNFRKIVKVARENGIESTDPIYATTNKKRNEYLFCKAIQGGCSAGFVSITIDSDLSVYPCARLRINVGNLREKSLSDILKASPIINTLCNRRLLKGKCQRCPKKFICGGCRAAAFSVSGDYLGEDPQCIL